MPERGAASGRLRDQVGQQQGPGGLLAIPAESRSRARIAGSCSSSALEGFDRGVVLTSSDEPSLRIEEIAVVGRTPFREVRRR